MVYMLCEINAYLKINIACFIIMQTMTRPVSMYNGHLSLFLQVLLLKQFSYYI